MDEDTAWTAAASTRRTDGPSRRGPRVEGEKEKEKGPPRDWQRGLDGPILWLSAVTRPIRNGPSNILMRVGCGEREARIGGPKFRVSSWLINRSPDLFTPQGIGPLWLTSRVDACQLTMANRSLRVYLRYQASLSRVLFALETETMRIDRGN